MKKSIKTAVSLPEDTYRRAESLRRKNGASRSALYASALQEYFKALEVRDAEDRYAAGYRAAPEDPADLKAWAKAAGSALGKEDW
ncbi:MAG: hypothetical protein HZB91_00285 [Elusimicrobia bacterium]|nr:hypothetical protein [Elusimicrobiota bacterium]